MGKILIDDVWSGGSSKDGNYPLMSNAIAKGLYHPNCKDGHTTYFEGISTLPDSTWTKEEINNIENSYKQEQKEKYAGNQAKRFGRLAKYSLSQENSRQYKILKDKWENQAVMSLTESEKGAIIRYVSPDSYAINDKLRRNATSEFTDIEKEWKDNIDKALDKLPCYKGNLNRSVTFNDDAEALSFFECFKEGEEYIPKQYLSTTKKGVYNEGAQVQIYIQNTQNGKDLGDLSIENEVLYRMGSRFKVINKVVHNGKYVILLEEA